MAFYSIEPDNCAAELAGGIGCGKNSDQPGTKPATCGALGVGTPKCSNIYIVR